jgi:hypothetical protein
MASVLNLPLTTRQVAKRLGVSYGIVIRLVQEEKIQRPARDSSGDYAWSDDDVQAARAVLEQREQRRRAKATA